MCKLNCMDGIGLYMRISCSVVYIALSHVHVHVGGAPRPAGTAAVKGLLPPDKKKFEREVKEIGSQIKDLESQRVSFTCIYHVQCTY